MKCMTQYSTHQYFLLPTEQMLSACSLLCFPSFADILVFSAKSFRKWILDTYKSLGLIIWKTKRTTIMFILNHIYYFFNTAQAWRPIAQDFLLCVWLDTWDGDKTARCELHGVWGTEWENCTAWKEDWTAASDLWGWAVHRLCCSCCTRCLKIGTRLAHTGLTQL